MRRIGRIFIISMYGAFLLSACDKSVPSGEQAETPVAGFPQFDEPQLQLGRQVWIENCQACHGTGLAGAPKIGDKRQWQSRIAKGPAVLYQHAQNGFQGPSGSEMPARGGNDALSDEQVRAAVDYMLKVSQ